MSWLYSQVLELISLYKAEVTLWDCQDYDYKNQVVRNKSWAKLAKHFGREIDEVKKKIKNIRNGYLAEKKRVNRLKNKGIACEPQLFYYNQLSFIDSVQFLRGIPRDGDDPLTNTRANSTISFDGSFENPKRKCSNSSDDLLQNKDENEEEDEIVEISSRRSSFNDSEGCASQMQDSSVQPLPIANHVRNKVTQRVISKRKYPCKEDTFCAMICSELRLLKSEETYDDVTAQIFVALKNAKAADRKNTY